MEAALSGGAIGALGGGLTGTTPAAGSRSLAVNGAVTMDTNMMNGPAAVIPGSIWNGSASNLWSGNN